MRDQRLFVGFDEVEVASNGDELIAGIASCNFTKPVWTYWFPLLCFLSRGDLVPGSAIALSVQATRFIYPIELRWEAVEWCALAEPDDPIAVIPAEVVRAIRGHRAIVVVSIAHEGRLLWRSDGGVTIFDKVGKLAATYGIRPEQLWLVTGRVGSNCEVDSWRRARGAATLPFTFRACEPFSQFVGGCARESLDARRAPYASVTFSRQGVYEIGWRLTRLVWVPRAFPWSIPEPDEKIYRYACLNRMFRPHRWRVLLRLWQEGMLEHGLVSFPFPARNDWIEAGTDPLDPYVQPLVGRLPLVADRRFRFDDESYFGENAVAVGLHPPIVCRDCSMELVTETIQAESLFLSEKTFKALIGPGPVVVVGTKGVLAYLDTLGVETWGDVVDQSYDAVNDPVLRLTDALNSALSLLTEPRELARAVAVNQGRRERNLQWLIGGPKPWQLLMRELAATLRTL